MHFFLNDPNKYVTVPTCYWVVIAFFHVHLLEFCFVCRVFLTRASDQASVSSPHYVDATSRIVSEAALLCVLGLVMGFVAFCQLFQRVGPSPRQVCIVWEGLGSVCGVMPPSSNLTSTLCPHSNK